MDNKELTHNKKKSGNTRLITQSVFAVLMLICLVCYLLYDRHTFDIIPKLSSHFRLALNYILMLSVPAVYFASTVFDLVYTKKNKEKLSVYSVVVFVLSFAVNIALILALLLQRYFV